MPKTSTAPGSLPKGLGQIELFRGILADRGEIEASHVTGFLPGTEALALSLNTVLMSVQLPESNLNGLSAKTTRWEGCDLSNSDLSRASIHDTLIQGSRLTGINLSESTWNHALLTDCKIDLCNLRFAKLTNVTFRGCSLVEADFAGATLTKVRFENCRLTSALFAQCQLKDVDLRTSQVEGIGGVESLSGATISSAQLLEISQALAGQFGIIVKD